MQTCRDFFVAQTAFNQRNDLQLTSRKVSQTIGPRLYSLVSKRGDAGEGETGDSRRAERFPRCDRHHATDHVLNRGILEKIACRATNLDARKDVGFCVWYTDYENL